MVTAAPLSRTRSILLWVAAALLMAASLTYQRKTGPTYPLRGAAVIAGKDVAYSLVRSQETIREARVALPDAGVPGTLVWRHYPTQEDWIRQPMVKETKNDKAELAGYLPIQPPAGKVEYSVEVGTGAELVRIPKVDPIVLRFKGPVPLSVLLPHVFMMFMAVMLGLRTALGCLFGKTVPRRHLWVTLAFMTVGGLILGPMVQKYAFGAYWTGWPFGYDLTDNKTLLMWLAWVVAALAAGPREHPREGWSRVGVALATVAMIVVYVIPHSLRGSQLDYSKVKAGGSAHEAITTGR
ncbi:MAG: hypothetical protein NTW40_07550 [Acidobacteria bacterium]|nr:hypothetical protein [Acidobacteriota bacterium]